LPPTSIYRLLHDEGARLFPDELFADLFQDVGRRSIPPRIVAVVMVLQRFEGLSDREAVDRFSFDIRWKYAAGGLEFTYPSFVHTVLVDMRERLRMSREPDRIFERVLEVARAAGTVGRRRVLDSTPLYDAVATQDTVTLIRSAIRGLLAVADGPLELELRGVLKRDDDYAKAGKPVCDWEDKAAREALVDALAREAYALLAVLHDRTLTLEVRQAAALLATVVGQDLEQSEEGIFRIAKRVAEDRVISTVDTEARHGRKTTARGFDGYKGHISIDPDSEIITANMVTPGNVADGTVAMQLLEEALPSDASGPDHVPSRDDAHDDEAARTEQVSESQNSSGDPVEVFGDASYGNAENLKDMGARGVEPNVKVLPPGGRGDLFTKDAFNVDLDRDTVTCPNGQIVQIRRSKSGFAVASFGLACSQCPLASSCTTDKNGRTLKLHPDERTLQAARARQRDPAWRARYNATRPKVERKIAHLMHRRHGGRRACVRGTERVGHAFSLLCAAANLNRLAKLQLRHDRTATGEWKIAAPAT
jgi:hypothetical protein